MGRSAEAGCEAGWGRGDEHGAVGGPLKRKIAIDRLSLEGRLGSDARGARELTDWAVLLLADVVMMRQGLA